MIGDFVELGQRIFMNFYDYHVAGDITTAHISPRCYYESFFSIVDCAILATLCTLPPGFRGKQGLLLSEIVDDFLRIGERTEPRPFVDGGGAACRDAMTRHLQ
ncbi:hypothetical protein D3C87_1936700 [compost metagenome]